MGFLAKTKIKADTKLSVVRFSIESLKRHLAAIFDGDRRRGRPVNRIRNFENISFSKVIITPLTRPRPDFRECVTSMSFQ